jgi:predicted helicase
MPWMKALSALSPIHSWLDNPTFRGMRQSLMRSFNQIYVLDLHGNAKKKERSPDGSDDQNVFDIEQGVAISLLVKKNGAKRGIWRADWWGKRLAKYQAGAEQTINSVEWQKLDPRAPDYLMLLQDYDQKAQYGTGWKVTDIFSVNSVGIVTARDKLCIHFDEAALMKTVRDFAALDSEAARQKYKLGKDVDDWKVGLAQADVNDHEADESYAMKILYRPGDDRWTYLTRRSRGFICRPRQDAMHHMTHDNIGLITSRLTKGEVFKHVQVTDKIIEVICMSPTTSNNGFLFPLYLYPPEPGQRRTKSNLSDGTESFAGHDRIENIAPVFRQLLDEKYELHFSPEELFGYIYAVLHAPAYRSKYAEFLRADFPRIPFPESADDFETLSGLGWALVQAHLLRELPRPKLAAYHGKGDHTVEAVRYSPEEQAIAINKTQVFKPVPQAVWDFHIGGYQVLDKYLKSRKGRVLSLDEINHVSGIADSLAFTIEQMARIDAAYQAAFPDRG